MLRRTSTSSSSSKSLSAPSSSSGKRKISAPESLSCLRTQGMCTVWSGERRMIKSCLQFFSHSKNHDGVLPI